MVKHLGEKLKSHRECQKGTKADAIIQIHPPTTTTFQTSCIVSIAMTLQYVKTLQSVKILQYFKTLQSVKTLQSIKTLQSVKKLQTDKKLWSVKTL